ncbi:oligosaccharide flippase family protein [uncultured Victivallis sp.]|uniref:oligosaccharide flippase family protein n=1 Tax=uncultured Victivallis sp. TaxID=354118 RepID=UPI0025952EEA|nr:oligosaccharide flippase family protein [uncultured Victivallis sp.]
MSSRLAKVIALSLGQGLSSVALIASSIVCNRFLSMADLATYRQTMLAYEFAVPFLTLGIPSSLYYFLSGAKERRRGIIIDNIAISLVMGSIFSVFLLLGGNRLLALRFDNPALETTLRWFIIYPLLTFPVLSLNSVLIICDRITLSAVFQLCTKCLLVAGVIITCIATRSYEWPLLVKIMVAGISLPAMLYIVFRTVRGGADWPRLKNIRQILIYSVPLGLASIAGSVSISLDKVIVSSMCTPESFAVYSSGAIQLPFIGIITGSITTVILAEMTLLCKEGKLGNALELFRRIPAQTALFLFPLMVFCILFNKDIILLFYGQRYEASHIVFLIYLCSIPISIVTYGSAFTALNRTAKYMQVSIEELAVNFVLSCGLVYLFGAWGAALGTILACYFWAVPRLLYILSREFKCSIFHMLPFVQLGKTLLCAAAAGAISAAAHLIPGPSAVKLLCGGIVFGCCYLAAAWFFMPQSYAALLGIVKRNFLRRTVS